MRYFLLILFFFSIVKAQNGVIKTYYPDGTPRSESSFVNDVLDGLVITFYSNGNIMYEKYFSNGILNGTVKEFFDTGLLKEEYTVKNGKVDGTERTFYSNGSLKSISIYNQGVLSQVKSFEYDAGHVASPEDYLAGNRQQELLKNKQKEVICDVDVCPFPVGGLETIYDNLIYPEHALLYGLEGTVTLTALVDEKGDVANTNVVKYLGLGCDEAAQNAVKKTKFIPGQKMNKIVESNVTLNIDFKIVDKKFVKNVAILSKTKDQLSNAAHNESNINSEKQKNEEYIFHKAEDGKSPAELSRTIEIRCDDADECPFPEEGTKSIFKNMYIPFIAKRLKLKGEIIVEANVDKYGITKNTKIISGIGYGCDDAVESALMKTKFRPAKKSGTEVDSKILIYFPFNYEE
jgi:TonB family protein